MIFTSVKGKIAIVTGAAGELGAACALKLAEAGANVVVADINLENAKKVSGEIMQLGVHSKAFTVDVTNENEVTGLADAVVNEFGSLDIMVNSAGIGLIKPITDFSKEEITRIISINLTGTLFCCKAALSKMIPQKSGKIVNFSSCGAKMGLPGCAVYAATKAGVIATTHTLAREAAEHNININAVSPGMIRTPMWENQLNFMTGNGPLSAKDEIFDGWIGGMIPLKRPQEPEDFSNMVLFLCSDLAKNIAGQTINVDGGAVIF